MKIVKLETAEEKFRAERLLNTAFLHDWNEEDARKSANIPGGEAWGALDETGRMVSAVTTLRHDLTYEGAVISCGEIHMVGTLPEARGTGAVRELMGAILREFRSRGNLFTTLIPFSFAFYRKYGFEAASEMLVQKAGVEQFASFRQEFRARQILSQREADEAHRLYTAFVSRYNLADLRGERDWTLRENGEIGERSWGLEDRAHYSYLLYDADGKPRAFFTFAFVHGPEGPFVGKMAVTELVFDSPEALRNVFGFFYGMRAKITEVTAELPTDVDWSVMLPESDSVERKLDGHMTARVLQVENVLAAMRQPEGCGQYRIRVTDAFLPENTGTYTVDFRNGKAEKIVKGEEPADLEVTVETFCQLAVRRISLETALYREGTVLNANEALLRRVFVKKPGMLQH